ncbi:hypothetical protein PLANTIT3_30019 [Plantibacter sp. T3]|nr:hypothetical protein PLANTIT3_30019 [Plantibacter sp. T3]
MLDGVAVGVRPCRLPAAARRGADARLHRAGAAVGLRLARSEGSGGHQGTRRADRGVRRAGSGLHRDTRHPAARVPHDLSARRRLALTCLVVG